MHITFLTIEEALEQCPIILIDESGRTELSAAEVNGNTLTMYASNPDHEGRTVEVLKGEVPYNTVAFITSPNDEENVMELAIIAVGTVKFAPEELS